jgi:chromosome segregation ATPase
MARWLIQRRLAQNSARLKRLRAELAQADEQIHHFNDDADDTALRALVSETPGASKEASEARKHAVAMAHHREQVVASIAELEARQDALLDQLTEGT